MTASILDSVYIKYCYDKAVTVYYCVERRIGRRRRRAHGCGGACADAARTAGRHQHRDPTYPGGEAEHRGQG